MLQNQVPLPQRVGEEQKRVGFFTHARVIRMQPAREIESRLGYRAGRFARGWWLMFLTRVPDVHEFEFRGMTHMSGGRYEGHKPGHASGPTAEQMLRDRGLNLTGTSYQKVGIKQQTRAGFTVTGDMRLAKVLPVAPEFGDPDVPDYPPGTGFPQWTLVQPVPMRAAAFIGPGEVYAGNYV